MKHLFRLLFVVMTTLLYHCNNAQQVKQKFTIPAEVFADKVRQTPNAILLDVRTPEEFKGGFIGNARNMDYNSPYFQAEINALDKNRPYFVYCLSGSRSSAAANYMRSNGFTEVYDMRGGMLAWEKKNLKLSTTSGKKIAADKISMEEYHKIISGDTMVLIDFYAPWCGPCKKMEPMLAEFARENEGEINVVRLNIDENKHLAKQLGIVEIPVLKIFKQGKEKWTHSGLLEKPALIEAMRSF